MLFGDPHIDFRAAFRGRFAAPVLMHDSVLIQVESAAARAAERFRIGVDLIATRRNGQRKQIAVLFTLRQAVRDQARLLWAGLTPSANVIVSGSEGIRRIFAKLRRV